MWIAHHNLYTHLRFVDPVLLRLNLLLLLAAAFLPFPTAIMAQAFDASENAERVAVAFYGGTALVIELLLGAAITYAASRPDLTDTTPPGAPPPSQPKRHWREAVTASLYALAILAGIFIFPRLAAAAYLLVAIRGMLVIGGEGRLQPARADPALTHSAMRLRGLEPPRALRSRRPERRASTNSATAARTVKPSGLRASGFDADVLEQRVRHRSRRLSRIARA